MPARRASLHVLARALSLIIDVRGCQTDVLCNQQPASQVSLKLAIPTLLLLLLNLTACVFDGALYRETLSQMVQIYVLKALNFVQITGISGEVVLTLMSLTAGFGIVGQTS